MNIRKLAVEARGIEELGGGHTFEAVWAVGTKVRKIVEDQTVDGLVTRFEVYFSAGDVWLPARTHGALKLA